MTKLTCRVSPISLKVPLQSRALPTLKSESFPCFRIHCADYVVVVSPNRMSSPPSQNSTLMSSSSYVDPLSSAANCTRDIPYLEQLGVNAVRVYSVNASLNHDECMQMFENAGIYVM